MKTQEHYKPVIVLDAGKVLVNINPNLILEELSKRCGRGIGLSLPFNLGRLFFPLYVGTQSWENTLQIINYTLGLSIGPEEWRELWCRILTGEVTGMREALVELKSKFRLVALSNTDEVHWTFVLKKYPIFKLLDGWVVSYKEGVTKPDPAIYSAVVDRYCNGQLPFFYTDDSPRYIEAAQLMGWEAEVFKDTAHFKEEVRRRRASYLPPNLI